MVLRARGSTDATVGSGKVRSPGGGRGNGNGRGPNGGGGASGSGWDATRIDADMSFVGNLLYLPDANGESGTAFGTQGRGVTGDWYFELTLGGSGNSTQPTYGIGRSTATTSTLLGTGGGGLDAGWIAGANGGFGALYMYNFPYNTTSARPTYGDVVGVRLRPTVGGGTLEFYKNGVYQNNIQRGEFASNLWYPAVSGQNLGSPQNNTVLLNTGSPLYLPSGATAWG